MYHRNESEKRTAAGPAMTTFNNNWKNVNFILILCIVLALSVSCKKSADDANRAAPNDETNMVLIPAGEFEMGNNEVEHGPHGTQEDESPMHTVYVDAFYIDKYEVTNVDFKKFLDANPHFKKEPITPIVYLNNLGNITWNGNNHPSRKDHHPVNVTWYEAVAYAKWVGKRLPTEAEWEKAARGGLENKNYPWGNSISTNLANYEVNPSTVSTGSYPPDNYGLYDMAGNVAEWCLDEYQADFYKDSPKRNPIAGADSIMDIINNYKDIKSPRVLRGGNWVFGPDQVRVSRRSKQPPEKNNRTIGFRCVKPVRP